MSRPGPSTSPPTGAASGGAGRSRRLVVALVAGIVLLAAVAVPVTILLAGDDEPQGPADATSSPTAGSPPGDSEPESEPGATSELEVVQAVAAEFFVRLNTYGPDLLADDGTMPDYRASVRELTTSDFGATFEQAVELAEQSVAEGGVERTSEVGATGVSALGPDRAVVLVSGSTLTSGGEPVALRAEVVMLQRGGEWLVDDFAPILTGAEVDPALVRGPGPGVAARTRAAVAAARTAAPPLLGSDYRTPEQDLSAAREVTTEAFGADFAQTYRSLREQARTVESVVEPTVVAVGVSSVGRAEVEVLVLADREATTTEGSQTFGDQVTFTMRFVGGAWLVDGLSTTG